MFFESETGTEFKPEQPLTKNLLDKCQKKKKELPDITKVKEQTLSSSEPDSLEEFLAGIGLCHLLEIFVEEGVTIDVLHTFDDNDLKEIGIQKLGERRKILNSFSPSVSQGKYLLYLTLTRISFSKIL